MVLLFLVNPATAKAMGMTGLLNAPEIPVLLADGIIFSADRDAESNESRLIPARQTQAEERYTTIRTVTAYSSTVDQCDDTPFITANGTHVRDGIVAANWLRFGTRVRIPEMFGDKVFVVTDRMNTRFDDRLDIWMEERGDAVAFGLRHLTIEVL